MNLIGRVVLCAATAFLVACGGGSSEGEDVPTFQDKHVVSYATSPHLHVRNAGDPVSKNDSNRWNFNARYLGRDFERSNHTARSNTLTAAWHEGGFESAIHVTPSDWQDVLGGGPHTVYSIDTEVQLEPMIVTYTAEVSNFSGTGVGQLSFIMYLQHKVTMEKFGLVFAMFDSRANAYERFVDHDYNTYFYSAPVQTISKQEMQMDVFGKTSYKLEMTEAVLRSIKPDYQDHNVILFGFLHEVFVQRDEHVTMAVKVEDLKIRRP